MWASWRCRTPSESCHPKNRLKAVALQPRLLLRFCLLSEHTGCIKSCVAPTGRWKRNPVRLREIHPSQKEWQVINNGMASYFNDKSFFPLASNYCHKTWELLKTIALNTRRFILTNSLMFYFLFTPDFLSHARDVRDYWDKLPHPTKMEVVCILSEGDLGLFWGSVSMSIPLGPLCTQPLMDTSMRPCPKGQLISNWFCQH